MSEIIQLYKDSNKTIKVYPKAIASEVYLDEENNIINKFDEINSQLDTMANKMTHLRHMGVAFDTTNEDIHVSWTHTNVSYDESDESFFIVYNAQKIHGPEAVTVTWARKKPKYGDFSEAIKIADRRSENISCKTQSSGICQNGDYLTITNHAINNVTQGMYIYRSKDKGYNWDNGTPLIVNGEILKAYSGDVTGFKRLKNGRILLWYWTEDLKSHALYSDDNGYTWNKANLPSDSMYVTEVTFVELSDETIIGYGRDNITNGSERYKKPAYFVKSNDGGLSYDKPIFSKCITDMSNNNCCFIQRPNSNIIEIVYGSRYRNEDDLGSIYQAITTEEELKNDNWSKPIRIGKGNAIPTSDNGDFGYFGSATDDEGTTMIFFYNGNKTKSFINYMIGNSNTNITFNENVDYKKGCNNINFNYKNDAIYNNDAIQVNKGVVSGNWDENFKGFYHVFRKGVNGERYYCELSIGSGGDLILELRENIDGIDTSLGMLKIQDGTVTLPKIKSLLEIGSKIVEGDKGIITLYRLLNNANYKSDITINSSGQMLIYAINETDGTKISISLNDLLFINNSSVTPSVDKTISIGTYEKRFIDGYFTGLITTGVYSTSNRPRTPLRGGTMVFDSTLGKPIWYNWDKSAWVDANGTIV